MRGVNAAMFHILPRIPLALLIAMIAAPSANAAEIRVMSGGAPKEVLTQLIPRFEQATGHTVKLDYVLIAALRERISKGEAAPDVAIMPTTAIAALANEQKLNGDSMSRFGTLNLIAIARDGAAKPDISTPEKFREAFLAARSIVYSTPTATPSGAHMAQVVAKLNIGSEVEKKVTYRPALEGGAEMVADGKAEIGVYPSSEVVHVKGVTQIGPLPEALQLNLIYAGATHAQTKVAEPARALIRFLSSSENKGVWRDAGFGAVP